MRIMKITDNYAAKYEIWARDGRAIPIPRISNLPEFGHRRFNSYEELNAWKESLLQELFKEGGAKWTES